MRGLLSSRGRLYVPHLDVEVERLACQGMIEIDDDGFVLDCVDAHGDGFPPGTLGRQHRSHLLRLRRKLVARNFLERVGILLVTVLGFNHDFLLIADFQSRELLFKTAHDLSAAMQVCQRLFTDVGVDNFAGVVGERVFDRDDRVLLDNLSRFQLTMGAVPEPMLDICVRKKSAASTAPLITNKPKSCFMQSPLTACQVSA